MIKIALHNILQDNKNQIPQIIINKTVGWLKYLHFFFSVLPSKWYAIHNLIETANKNKWKKYNIMSGNFSYLQLTLVKCIIFVPQH